LLAKKLSEKIPNIQLLQADCSDFVFYYDFLCSEDVHSEHLKFIEDEINCSLKKGIVYENFEMVADNAAQYFSDKGFDLKSEILSQHGKEIISLVRLEGFVDFIFETLELNVVDLNYVRLLKVEEKDGIKRIYGVVGSNKMDLKKSSKAWEESSKYNGLETLESLQWAKYKDSCWSWTPNGCRLRSLILREISSGYKAIGCEKIITSLSCQYSKDLEHLLYLREWNKSGKYYEISPDLEGGSTFDLATMSCKNNYMQKEIISYLQFFVKIAKIFDFDKRFYVLSKGDSPRGGQKYWCQCQNILEDALQNLNEDYEVKPSSYDVLGPTIAMLYVDRWGRVLTGPHITFNCRTEAQLGRGQNELQQVLSCSVVGSLERFIIFLIENSKGALPLTFLPEVVRVLTVEEEASSYAETIVKTLKESNIRACVDFSSRDLNAKIKDSYHDKIPYVVVVGKSEEQEGLITVRELGKKVFKKLVLTEFVDKLSMRINEKLGNKI